MMMDMILNSATSVTVDLDQLWRGLLTLAGVVAILSLAFLILKIMGTIKRINNLIDIAEDPLKEALDQLPTTITHLNNISGNLEDLSTEVTKTVPALLADVQEVSKISVELVDSSASLLTEVTDMLSKLLTAVQKPFSRAGQATKIFKSAKTVAGVAKRFKRKKK